VTAALNAHSLLAAHPAVDADRIGLTGISWGGYMTCVVAGVDPRYKFAVPVYGCGFLALNSAWSNAGPGSSTQALDLRTEVRPPSESSACCSQTRAALPLRETIALMVAAYPYADCGDRLGGSGMLDGIRSTTFLRQVAAGRSFFGSMAPMTLPIHLIQCRNPTWPSMRPRKR
jgi:hypothetical protein